MNRRGLLAAVVAAMAGGVAVTWWYIAATWSAVRRLAYDHPVTTAFIEQFRAQQRASGKPDRVEWRWVPFDSISPNLKRAVIASEDIAFFSHHGFDLDQMKQALATALRERATPRGASTITQQLAKNLWLSPSRNPLRKAKEAILTRELEDALTKRRILEIYLNVVQFGPGIYGAEAAARHYFDKSPIDLGEHEAALLAAGLPRPRTWNPGSPSRSYHRQVTRLEDRVSRATFLWSPLGEKPPAADEQKSDTSFTDFLRSDSLFRPEIPVIETDSTAGPDSSER